MTLHAVKPRKDDQQEILSLLDEIRARVERGEVSSLCTMEIGRTVDDPMLFHSAGGLLYSQAIGLLELAKLELYRMSLTPE